jgi:hypothetical protein
LNNTIQAVTLGYATKRGSPKRSDESLKLHQIVSAQIAVFALLLLDVQIYSSRVICSRSVIGRNVG